MQAFTLGTSGIVHAFRLVVLAACLSALAGAQGFPLWQVPTPLLAADGFGRSAAVIDDVNADGIPDVAVGAPSSDNPFFPTPATYTLVLSGATGSLIHAFVGPNTTDHFGASVAGVGDVNGDGVGDIAIGAPGPGGSGSIGMVEIRSGATGGVIRTLTIAGSFGDRLGASVARGGDLDGDGVEDTLAGAPVLGSVGRAVAFSGATGALIRTFIPPVPTDELGDSVASVGDVNGDGVPDVVAGAPGGTTPFNQFPGKAIVFSGATAAPLYTMTGNAPGDRFGVSAAALGDVNADGVPDVVIGASGTAQIGGPQPQPRAEIRSGAVGAVILTLLPAFGTVAGFGFAVVRAADLDGDGRADAVVGAPGGRGRVTVFSSVTGVPLLTFEGAVDNGLFGYSVAAGDLNGDGLPDFVAGAPGAPGAGFVQPPGLLAARSPIGIAPSTVRYGTACPGTGGFAPSIWASGGPATVGNSTFGLAITQGIGGGAAVLFVSATPAPSGFPIGGGCSAWLGSPFIQFGSPITLSGPAGVAGAGHGILPIPVPLDFSLVGLTLFWEWGIVDSGGPTGIVSVSDALSVTVP